MTEIRALVLLVALLVPALPLSAALQGPEKAPQRGSLAGQFLIASPAMGDPRFYHTVILMVRHDRHGAMGLVINRPGQERSLKSLLDALGEKDAAVDGSVRVFAGGPVQPNLGFVLHSAEYQRPETVPIASEVAMTSSRAVLHDMAKKEGPKKVLVAFGYAGWGPGQLEGELKLQAWFVAAHDPQLVFDADRDKLWDEAMKRRTQEL
jgi:putative transcriptional regulator